MAFHVRHPWTTTVTGSITHPAKSTEAEVWHGENYFQICGYLCWGKNQLQKNFGRRFLIGWKKFFFLIFTFQSDVCTEPTCTVMCFIHFVIRHCSDNIWIILPFSIEIYACWIFFSSVFIYLFICFTDEWVWNVWVNQKGFQLKLDNTKLKEHSLPYY